MSSAEFCRLAEDEIHVWHAALDPRQHRRLDPARMLSLDEQQRAARFHFERDRVRFALSRSLLRVRLGSYLDIAPASIVFEYGDQGKPRLAERCNPSGLEFNLAHSGDVVVMALSWRRPLGVDVEQVRPDVAIDDLARRFFAVAEVEQLHSVPIEHRREAFFRVWTRKEAFLKARGTGLTEALDSFVVSCEIDHLPPVRLTQPGPDDGAWHLYPLRLPDGYQGAVCTAKSTGKVRQFQDRGSDG